MYAIDYNSYRTVGPYGKRVRFLVLHYTALDFAQSVQILTTGAASAHYLIPDASDPTYLAAGFSYQRVFNLVDENDRAWHAGVSEWAGRVGLNDTSIGIEIVNQATDVEGVFSFPDYQPSQIAALKQLAKNILQRYPDMSPKNVVGHSDIAVGRKSDPGPKLPWKELAEEGIGAWYEKSVKDKYLLQFSSGVPGQADVIQAFARYGYGIERPVTDTFFSSLVRAFQLHFRADNYDGVLDAETCAILYALNEKYA
ncbi:N-acetylmuramoyl-L-alanine amidase [Pseudomonas sp. 5P_3.1_Bac2]|uniref:N-acetylmuramoyl-L-alanine amidase n=1 Tax=Pseudomonas sp. 5P_3.1_Bac2 TaxID=2971617 RepID=UPI0021C6AF5A|nr:N-acetylmuramoyl-L-alanine amidase [Pseudomonas sp. 5P_3.1_Bac2]MCU1717093.1 N-acetylmuramoyl-L-alanine amidase [Pseudomonas sp. 5P_3.1_Bac2]